MTKIVLSYRRVDSDVVARRMHDRLAKQYGEDSVFIDVDNVPVGKDYRQHIKDALLQSDVLIVIVGSKWLGGGKKGQSRIADVDDPVRVEVETALQNGIPIVPVLFADAKMPSAAQLPESLKKFSYINAASIDTGRDFHQHMERLIQTMNQLVKDNDDTSILRTGHPARHRTSACYRAAI